jgi:hypothetical protein
VVEVPVAAKDIAHVDFQARQANGVARRGK